MNAVSFYSTDVSSSVSTGVYSDITTSVGSRFCAINKQVEFAVCQNPHLKQRRISFQIYRGRVTLQGSVGSYFEKQMAQESLRHIEGISQIDNQLEVDWDNSISEEWT